MSVDISEIRRDGGTQSRAAINEATVAEYAEAMADPNTVFPPVIVYFDGREYWLADGFHRLAAWERIGRTDIPAEVRQGDRRAAILHSVAANSAHGLRRTNEDKRRAVLTLLEDAEWSAWSDSEIARRCAVSRDLVAAVRTGLTIGRPQVSVREAEKIARSAKPEDPSAPRTYVTKHGTTATMNTANIGGGKALTEGEEITPKAQENKAETPLTTAKENQPAEGEIVSDKPEPEASKEDPETAKARRALAKLTREALEDEVLGLRAEVADHKAKGQAMKVEIEALKEKLRDATADDLGASVGRLQRRLDQANFSKAEALKIAAKAEREVRHLRKRVAELEAMGVEIPL